MLQSLGAAFVCSILLAHVAWQITRAPPPLLDPELLRDLRKAVPRPSAAVDRTIPVITPALPKRPSPRSAESKERTKKFASIHKENKWESRESRSGWGSELNYTADVRSFLNDVLLNYSAQTMLDAPCGDVNWQSSISEIANGNTKYLGVDIVPDLIERNKEKFAKEEHMDFTVMDLASDRLDELDPFGECGIWTWPAHILPITLLHTPPHPLLLSV